MTREHFNKLLADNADIRWWLLAVSEAVGVERMESVDFNSCRRKIFIKPKYGQYRVRLWREYVAFDRRTLVLAKRPFRCDKRF
jgi:hypothetical protein